MLKSIYSTRIIYVLSLGFVKVSLLIFYLRLDHRRYMKWIVYALQFVVVGLTIASVFILAFSCYPPAKFWDLTGEAEGHCMDPDSQQVFYEANGILNIITDICIYLAPIPMLWGVRISNVCTFPQLNERTILTMSRDVKELCLEYLASAFCLLQVRVCCLLSRMQLITHTPSWLRAIRLCEEVGPQSRPILQSRRLAQLV